jgi:branched-chain amino acid transport system permease protein
MTTLLQALVDAVSSGSFYALIALGIALVFGVMRLVNMAYGEIIVGSVFAAFFLQSYPFYVVLPGMIATGVVIAVVTERVAFRPLRHANPTTMLIASFAVSFILQNAALATVGASPRGVSTGSSLAQSYQVGPLQVPAYSIVTVGTVLVIVILLRLFLVRTSVGISMRAASEDFDCARLLGVRANSVILVAFVLSGTIAAIVGYLLVSQTGGITPTSGLAPALLGFVAVVVGGMGSLPAAASGGLLLGFATVALQYVLPNDMLVFRDAFLFTGVLLLLIWRPQGLFVRQSTVATRV